VSQHIREIELRRLRAGELASEEADRARAHLALCPSCTNGWARLSAEQQEFERDVPFRRFETGIQQRMSPRQAERLSKPSRRAAGWPWFTLVPAVAAGLLVVFAWKPFGSHSDSVTRIKGGAEMEVRIASASGGLQRLAEATASTRLSPGDRVRIGYQAGGKGFIASFSVDEQGEFMPLHPVSGQSAPVEPGPKMHYLPDSFVLTGHGAERIYVVLSDTPLPLETLEHEARAAFHSAGGEVSHMPMLRVPGEQLSRVLEKP